MYKFRSAYFLLSTWLVVPLARAHPGHENADNGWLARVMHDLATLDQAWWLLAIGACVGLWFAARRLKHPARVGGRAWRR